MPIGLETSLTLKPEARLAMKQIVLLNPADNVATSLAELAAGTTIEIEIDGRATRLILRDAVPFAHKIALRRMAAGDDVIKYGEVIGKASRVIAAGDWVHVHNVDSARARGDIRQ